MCEDLFRGRRRFNGEWVYGSLVHLGDFCAIVEHDQNRMHALDKVKATKVPFETVGRYIGICDKHGTKIFDGDVVKTKFDRLCIVSWFSSIAYVGWDLRVVDTDDNLVNTQPPTVYDLWRSENLEVVGNIHDNPEYIRKELDV